MVLQSLNYVAEYKLHSFHVCGLLVFFLSHYQMIKKAQAKIPQWGFKTLHNAVHVELHCKIQWEAQESYPGSEN